MAERATLLGARKTLSDTRYVASHTATATAVATATVATASRDGGFLDTRCRFADAMPFVHARHLLRGHSGTLAQASGLRFEG